MRERIRSAARAEFLERGYDATTLRGVATRAGCDSAMVSYYFESKQRLFRECLNLPLDPAQEVLGVLVHGPAGAGERLARRALRLYEEQLTSDTMRALMRALMTDADTSQRFRDYVRNEVFEEVGVYFGAPAHVRQRIAEQIELAMSFSYGVATMRYLVQLEPLASMPREQLIRELASVIQHRVDRIFALLRG